MRTLGSGAPLPALARGYAPRPGGWDELVDGEGRVRPAWRTLLANLDAMGQPELRKRWEKARQLIHENGVSYNVYGDPQGMERPF